MAVPAGVPLPDLAFCFDADQAGGTDGATLGQLTDQSANAYHAVQGTAAAQGIYRATGLGGKPAVEFDGVDDNYQLPTAALGMFRNVGGGTIFAVVHDTGILSSTTGRRIFLASRNGSVAAGRFVTSHAEDFTNVNGGLMAGNTSGRRLDTDSVNDTVAELTNNDPVARIAVNAWSVAEQYHYRNGKQTGSRIPFQTAGLTADTLSGAVAVGASGTPNHFWKGTIAFVATWRRVLTEAERTDLGKLAEDRYGIPHTFTTARPTSTLAGGGWGTTAPSLHAALSDQSLATLITGTGV